VPSRCIAACAIRAAAPEGLRHVGSWIEASFERCFQLMEHDHARLLRQWVTFRGDPVEFGMVPVVRGRRPGAIEPLL